MIPDLAAGGAERTVLEVSDALIAAGARSMVVSRGGRLEDELTRGKGELIRMNAASKNPVIIRSNAKKIAALIEAEQIDLVHARSRAPAWSAHAACEETSTPFVTTYHGAYSGKSTLKIRYNSVMAKGMRVIANSDWIAAHVQKVHGVEPERLVTIPRGVDLIRFDPANVSPDRIAAVRASWTLEADDNRLILLLPARLTDWKGQGVAIQAMGILTPEERTGLVLVLAGDAQGRDNYVAELEKQATYYGLGDTLRIPGHCEDIPAACLAADIVLAPSKRPEAFGRTAAEASAMGRPVIVTDHGGGRETVVDGVTGARVAPGDPAALAGAIRAMISIGADARDNMGEAGAKYARPRFSKLALQIATLGVYKDVLDNQDTKDIDGR